MKICARTDIGIVRNENQDCFKASSLLNGAGWGIVCDGMGGAKAGKLAAEIAVSVFEKELNDSYWDPQLLSSATNILKNAFDQMNDSVYEKSQSDSEYAGMGTTAVACIVYNKSAVIAHVGDSRAYLFRNDRLIPLTTDHSMVQHLVEIGKITQEEAETHPQRNLITRAIGIEHFVQPDFNKINLQSGDLILLCSDGLHASISEDRIIEILKNTSFYDVSSKLVDAALRAGGLDNITSLVMQTEPGDTAI